MNGQAQFVVLDKGLLYFRANSLLSRLNAFSASINGIVSVSGSQTRSSSCR